MVVVVGVRVEGFAAGMRGRFQRWVMRRGGEARPRRAAVMVVKARAAVALQRSFRALKLVWILQLAAIRGRLLRRVWSRVDGKRKTALELAAQRCRTPRLVEGWLRRTPVAVLVWCGCQGWMILLVSKAARAGRVLKQSCKIGFVC